MDFRKHTIIKVDKRNSGKCWGFYRVVKNYSELIRENQCLCLKNVWVCCQIFTKCCFYAKKCNFTIIIWLVHGYFNERGESKCTLKGAEMNWGRLFCLNRRWKWVVEMVNWAKLPSFFMLMILCWWQIQKEMRSLLVKLRRVCKRRKFTWMLDRLGEWTSLLWIQKEKFKDVIKE